MMENLYSLESAADIVTEKIGVVEDSDNEFLKVSYLGNFDPIT